MLCEQVLKVIKLTGLWRVLGRPGSVVGCVCCSLTASWDAVLSKDPKSPAGPYSHSVTASHLKENHNRRATGILACPSLHVFKILPLPPQFWMTDPESFRARPLSALRAICGFISEPAQPAMLPRVQRPFHHTPRGPEHMEAPLFESQASRIP